VEARERNASGCEREAKREECGKKDAHESFAKESVHMKMG
jgi:hypothetical protein